MRLNFTWKNSKVQTKKDRIQTGRQKMKLDQEQLLGTSWLAHQEYLLHLFEIYQKNSSAVPSDFQTLFSKLNSKEVDLNECTYQSPPIKRQEKETDTSKTLVLNLSLQPLIDAKRAYGHLEATLDPLGLTVKNEVPETTLEYHQFKESDLRREFSLQGQFGLEKATLETVIDKLNSIYCQNIGFEYQYLTSQIQKTWIAERVEKLKHHFSHEAKKDILYRLLESEGLEKHLAAQFVAQKRFSIEGADVLMPMLNCIIEHGSELGIESFVLGMAHRGRLNVLVNFLGKPAQMLFDEFSGKYNTTDFASGDVKYHKGFSAILETKHKKVDVELAFNPSHLEVVNSIVEGITRAKQDQRSQQEDHSSQVLPILIHGDAAFSGQGVVMETLQLSDTVSTKTQGTIHLVINNQVGFTTSPNQARSTRYCTDVAKMIEAPILHINGSDPEAACWAVEFAVEYRMKFKKDIVIDLVCYRRYGHNEADEPAATQPLMYQKIRQKKPIWFDYAQQLKAQNVLKENEAENWLSHYRQRVAKGEVVASRATVTTMQPKEKPGTIQQNWRESIHTAVDKKTFERLVEPLTTLPQHMVLQPQVAKLMADRKKMLKNDLPLNWGTAEILAYATLIEDEYNIRITGQDTERGTFAHRHAVLHDYVNDKTYVPLQALAKHATQFSIYDSILSEMATMGFEYGYAYSRPNTLVIWEAQYGDFFNGAQVVIDQFLSAGEQKWGQCSNLVLFLPHGYEGAGPEHSSARLERFLQLCAQDNLQICVPTTPAQQFHLLRRQLLRRHWKKPLVIMTPKSLLRHKQATSSLEELTTGMFYPILWSQVKDASRIKRLIFCSGKIYYDLINAQKEQKKTDTICIRLEQLYPFPDTEIKEILNYYADTKHVIWCQEEPKNQGAWQWLYFKLKNLLPNHQTLQYIGRPEAASPAAGSPLRHDVEQKKIIQDAFK